MYYNIIRNDLKQLLKNKKEKRNKKMMKEMRANKAAQSENMQANGTVRVERRILREIAVLAAAVIFLAGAPAFARISEKAAAAHNHNYAVSQQADYSEQA